MNFGSEAVRQINLTERRVDKLPEPEVLADLASPFLALPGLRGFWPMSSFNEAGNAYDMSEQGRVLTYNGNPTYNFDGLVPYIDLDGTGDWLSRADEAGLDILGTETYVAGAAQGLTAGGWFWMDTMPGGVGVGLINKWAAAGNQRCWRVVDITTSFEFYVSANGINPIGPARCVNLSMNEWIFTIARYTPSVELKLWANEQTDTFVAGIPAALFNSSADLSIGRSQAVGGVPLDGRASLCFLCTEALSDGIISSLLQQTRGAFGV